MLSIRVEFLLVLPFVAQQFRIVFSVVRVLFFPYRMASAPILSVAMSMIDLGMTGPQKTAPEFGYAIGDPHVKVEAIKAVLNTLTRLGDV